MRQHCHLNRGALSGFARPVRVTAYPSGERQSVALEILGLDGLSESVYRAMLVNPDADLDALAVSLGVPSAAVREALERLIELSLVIERAPGRVYVPINPDVALDALLSLEQAELSRRERQLLEARAELARLVRNSQDGLTPIREVRRIDGRDRVLEVMHELSARCYQEALNVLPGAPAPAELLADAAEHDLAMVRRGVRLRTLHTRSQLVDEPMLDYVRMMQRHGADAGLQRDGDGKPGAEFAKEIAVGQLHIGEQFRVARNLPRRLLDAPLDVEQMRGVDYQDQCRYRGGR